MKTLLCGALGYIGAVMIEEFKTRGNIEITCLDTGYYASHRLYGAPTLPARLIRKDIRDVTVADLRGFDAVVHLGELSNDPLGEIDPNMTYRINHEGSVHLARTSREAGVSRFVYSSSCSVYVAGSGEFKNEDSELNPQTTYAECKVRVERDVSALANARFSPTFLRNATAYGPSPRMRFDLVLNNLAGLAHTSGQIRMTNPALAPGTGLLLPSERTPRANTHTRRVSAASASSPGPMEERSGTDFVSSLLPVRTEGDQ